MAPDRDAFDTLMTRLRAGDTAAFEDLVRGYGPAVERAARVLLGRPLRAQFDTLDLLQTVHRTLLLGLRTGRFSVSDPHHLRHLALTLLRRKIARRWREVKQQLETRATSQESPFSTSQDRVDPEPGPADCASLRDEETRYLQATAPMDRRLLELRIKGFSTAEVARKLGVDAAVLRVRLGRLRRKLLKVDRE